MSFLYVNVSYCRAGRQGLLNLNTSFALKSYLSLFNCNIDDQVYWSKNSITSHSSDLSYKDPMKLKIGVFPYFLRRFIEIKYQVRVLNNHM